MAQLIIQPDAATGLDTWLGNVGTTTNHGAETTMFLGTKSYSLGVWSHRRALLRLDLRSLLGVSSIDSSPGGVTLSVAADNQISVPQTFFWYRNTHGDWSELDATWLAYKTGSPWTVAGGDAAVSPFHTQMIQPGPTSLIDFYDDGSNGALGGGDNGLYLLVVDALASRGGYLDLIGVGPEISAEQYLEIQSSDSLVSGGRPSLTINYTPAIFARRNRARRAGSRGVF
jgi:hypothetical protein